MHQYYKEFPNHDEALRETGLKDGALRRKCLGSALCSGTLVSISLFHHSMVNNLLREGYMAEKPLTQSQILEDQTPVSIYDLIYDSAAKIELKAAFPDAVFEDDWDEIHGGRFTIQLTSTWAEYYYQIIKRGMHGCSLNCQMALIAGAKAKSVVERGLKAAIKRLGGEAQ